MTTVIAKKHIYSLDFIRFLSLFLIIIYHFLVEVETKSLYTLQFLSYRNTNAHIATLGVALFFMISGAGLMLSTENHFSLKSYYQKRFLRIYIPFYISYLGCLILKSILRRGWPFPATTAGWKMIFTLLGVDGYVAEFGVPVFNLGLGEWFLGCLILIYAIFPILRKCMMKNKWVTLGVATIIYLFIVCNYHYGIAVHLNIFVKLYEFILGMFFVQIRDCWKKPYFLLSVPIALLFIFCPIALPLTEGLRITIFTLSVFCLFVHFENFFSKKRPGHRFVAFICRYSFELFLVHHYIIYTIGDFLAGRTLSAPLLLCLFVAELLIMVVGALILNFCVQFVQRLFTFKK